MYIAEYRLTHILEHFPNLDETWGTGLFFSLQEVKSQPQNILMDAIFDDPWTNAYRSELIYCGQCDILPYCLMHKSYP